MNLYLKLHSEQTFYQIRTRNFIFIGKCQFYKIFVESFNFKNRIALHDRQTWVDILHFSVVNRVLKNFITIKTVKTENTVLIFLKTCNGYHLKFTENEIFITRFLLHLTYSLYRNPWGFSQIFLLRSNFFDLKGMSFRHIRTRSFPNLI